jgi:hypothetical protein
MPVRLEKSINLDDYCAMLLDILWTINFSLTRSPENPGPPAGVFSLRGAYPSATARRAPTVGAAS